MLKQRLRRGQALILTCPSGEQARVLVHSAGHAAVELHITAPQSIRIAQEGPGAEDGNQAETDQGRR
jgi:hypothetical protein